MPWPGIDRDKLPVPGIPQNTYGYIPSMVLTDADADADGNVIHAVSKELGRDAFLKAVEKTLTGA